MTAPSSPINAPGFKAGFPPVIILFIAQEDEEQAMKELGLLQGTDLPGN
jgi:hypothetical protein